MSELNEVNSGCDAESITLNNDISNVQYTHDEIQINKESEHSVIQEQNKSSNSNDCSDVTIVHKEDQGSVDEDDKLKTVNIRKKFLRIIDSDSEDENIFTSDSRKAENIHNSSDNRISDAENDINSINRMDSDDDNSSDEENIAEEKKVTNNIQSRFQTLIDTESEEDEDNHEKQLSFNNHGTNESHKNHSKSNMRKVSLRASKEEAMKQIQSETQRLIRETQVCLPYHRPKQRTVQEFLNRKKVLTVLPKAPTMAARLKLSSAIVDEVLKEKEKEAEIFYKSSDSEEEISEIHSFSNKENVNKQGTQKSIQNSVSRKLFVNDNLCIENNKKENNMNIMQKINEISTEEEEIQNSESKGDNSIENANNLTILETECEHNNTENKNENNTVKTTGHFEACNYKNDVLEKAQEEEKIDVCSEQGNLHINDDKGTDSVTINEFSTTCTQNVNNDYASIVRESLGIKVNEKDEYNEYGLPPPIFDSSPEITKKNIAVDIKSLKPKLKGTPGTMIDLSNDIKPNKKAINALINRYVFKHSTNNALMNDKSTITTTHINQNSDGLSIVKETLPYKLPAVVKEDPKLNKPGAKLSYLKEELRHKMAMKRDKEWKQKEQEYKEQEIEWNESINEEDNLSEPCSQSIESYISEEDLEELEEDLHRKKKNKKNKCTFIDDEAEISDDDQYGSDAVIDEDEYDETVEEDGETREMILEDANTISSCDSTDVTLKEKFFKRIIRSVEEDSRDCNREDTEDEVNKKGDIPSSQTMQNMSVFDESINKNDRSGSTESDIPVSQVPVENNSANRMNKTPQTKSGSFDFISPVMQLTALNTFSGSEKDTTKTEQNLFIDEIVSPLLKFTGTETASQNSKYLKEKPTLQKKLFSNDVTDKELIQIYSEKLSDEPNVTESQLLEVCSGTFASQTDNMKKSSDSFNGISQNMQMSGKENIFETNVKNSLNDVSDEIMQSVQAPLEEKSPSTDIQVNKTKKETKNNWNCFSIVSSDEENSTTEIRKKRLKKKVQKLQLSDDEEENRSLVSNNSDTDDDKFIDYDSEENEVVVAKKDITRYATTFLEEEAELSESDCDVSDDEDEEDLDKLELEEADDEEIDEEKTKNQLEKFHMKQILDEDQKEVRLLKELLFEEGDLYSENNRERKFKWRNIDKLEENDHSQPSEDKDGWVDLSDDEDEAKWRKIRHERDKFLAEKKESLNTEIENELNNSQIFNFGMKILKRRRINESEEQNTLLEELNVKEKSRIPQTIAEMLNNSNLGSKSSAIHHVMQKRSFLAKGKESLARLAALARRKDTSLPSMNTKNFVFTHVNSPTEDKVSTIETKVEKSKLKANR